MKKPDIAQAHPAWCSCRLGSNALSTPIDDRAPLDRFVQASEPDALILEVELNVSAIGACKHQNRAVRHGEDRQNSSSVLDDDYAKPSLVTGIRYVATSGQVLNVGVKLTRIPQIRDMGKVTVQRFVLKRRRNLSAEEETNQLELPFVGFLLTEDTPHHEQQLFLDAHRRKSPVARANVLSNEEQTDANSQNLEDDDQVIHEFPPWNVYASNEDDS